MPHFRREALEEAGGWDPYNVTEDADLGLRLARHGYRTGTLSLPTGEDAPTTGGDWMRQRTRWFKGWVQTALVHTRQPCRLVRELGLWQTVGFTVTIAGIVLSALIHPIYLAGMIWLIADPATWSGEGDFGRVLLILGIANLGAGYVAMALLSARSLELRRRGDLAAGLVWLPLYWLLMSIAAYRAMYELARRPFHWAKTPHAVHAFVRARCPPATAGLTLAAHNDGAASELAAPSTAAPSTAAPNLAASNSAARLSPAAMPPLAWLREA